MDRTAPNREVSRLESFARRILESGRLADKLEAPDEDLFEEAEAGATTRAVTVEAPARDAGLELGGRADGLPRPSALTDPVARALCMARFAHHELMAVELFAWALLRWPELPVALRTEWLRILVDEQRHCALYLGRLSELGGSLASYAPHSGYFWRQAPAIAASPHGPRAFLAAMGLTLEQANLDFTAIYCDAFRVAGDRASAEVCQQVHDDEIEHVRSAARWLVDLDRETGHDPPDLTAAYERAVPFPLSAARAKGRRFDADARERAGLDRAFVDHVRSARSSQETGVTRRGGPR